MLCLEPELFDQNFFGMPKFDLRTKEGKQIKEDLERAHPGKVGIKYEHFVNFPAISRNVRTSAVAKHFLSNLKPEVSAFFERDGIKCKARFDAWNEKLGCIIDLKTTENASRRVFEKSIFNYGYHRQAAWYLHAANKLGLKAKHFVIIAVEKKAPFLCAVYRLKDDVIELANKEINELLKLYNDCEKSDHWPGYSDSVEDIGIPAWGVTETNDFIEGE
jgi:exodeoxyribonuclease VIII